MPAFPQFTDKEVAALSTYMSSDVIEPEPLSEKDAARAFIFNIPDWVYEQNSG